LEGWIDNGRRKERQKGWMDGQGRVDGRIFGMMDR
jgi:hypothetical protein